MPTSNGQVTSRDIRQTAVKTLHIKDVAVTEPKLADLAVTLEKHNEPVHVAAFESNPGLGTVLTSLPVQLATITLDIPTWVGQLSVMASGYVNGLNDSGGDQNLFASVQINDSNDGHGFTTVPDTDWGQAVHFEDADLAAPGSTVEVSIYGHVSAGTTSNSVAAVWGVVIGTR